MTISLHEVAASMALRPEKTGNRSFVVLSPHLDDAVFSTWHILSSPYAVRPITVFAGSPESGWVTGLDRAHGADDSAAWMRRRWADDRAALALAGREPIHVHLLDAQYRAYLIPSLGAAIDADPTDFISLVAAEDSVRIEPDYLMRWLEPLIDADVIYGPVGIGGHPDHRDVGRFAVALAAQGREVRLYADTPYYLRYGLPSWISGETNALPDSIIDQALDALPVPRDRLARHAILLSPEEFARKMAAMNCYTTETEGLKASFPLLFSQPSIMRHEVYWAVT
jgi:LmbE family N-acetylglucosaminyl deacetylase